MSYGVCVKTSKDNKFLDFVVTDKPSKHVRRVSSTEINAQKLLVPRSVREAMEQSLKIAMFDLDFRSRNNFPIHRDWKKVATKVVGVSRIGV